MLYPAYPAAIEQKYDFVKRARFCYLYTQSGKRLTDMYQEAGRAILGWRGVSASTVFKNTFSRGASGSFCSQEAPRLKKAVRSLISGTLVVRWYTGETASELLSRTLPINKSSPSGWDLKPQGYVQWRPWEKHEPAPAFVFLPPFPLAQDVIILAAREDSGFLPQDAPASSVLSPCMLAGITRSIHDVIAEIPKRAEKDWGAYDTVLGDFWERRGAYLFPKISRERYGAFSDACLDAGLVISPDYDIPSIVPWGAHKGDFSALCNKMKSFYPA